MNGKLLAGVMLALIGVGAVGVGASLPWANEAVEQVAVAPAAVPIPTERPQAASAGFKAALAQVQDDPVAAFAAAAALPDLAERHAVQWAAIYGAPGRIAPADIEKFTQGAPGWLNPSLAQTRVEQSLLRSDPGRDTVLKVLGDTVPETLGGEIALARALLDDGQRDQAAALARRIWTENFLSREQEAEVLTSLGTLLDRDAHWARAQHLMMHDRAQGSERLLSFLSDAQGGLVKARAAVSRDEPDAKALLDAVDPAMRNDPVFVFSRVQRAHQHKLWADAIDWLDKAPDEVGDADVWWNERRGMLRDLLALGETELAYRAAAGFTAGSDGRMVEAKFNAGWIALAFLNEPGVAQQRFREMAEHATLTDSITQAQYWLGRASLMAGDPDGARAAFRRAAEHPTVYYGLLAQAELGAAAPQLRPLPVIGEDASVFEQYESVRAIRLLAEGGEKRLALQLLRTFGLSRTSAGDLARAAALAEELGAHNIAIAIADAADRQGIGLDSFAFPTNGITGALTLKADRAAVFAVVRQESMFQLDAVSSAGARGLMQLMPGTAKETAAKVGVSYSPDRLVRDAAYNTLLGSTYLHQQLDRYDGSLVLAAAAYNAGPGNANKWIKAFGDPRADNVDVVTWVELIPFAETRKYVQRVLGNYLVFREQLGREPLPIKQALRSIE